MGNENFDLITYFCVEIGGVSLWSVYFHNPLLGRFDEKDWKLYR